MLFGISNRSAAQLVITGPNGGEQFMSYDDTVIIWQGVPSNATVRLEYSTDAGVSWTTITDQATGNRFGWHVPKTQSNRCLIRVARLASGGDWVSRMNGGGHMDGGSYTNGHCVKEDAAGNIYVTGSFLRTASFGGVTITSGGKHDMFLSKYHPDGTVAWSVNAGAEENDFGYRLALDASGNIYVVGVCNGMARFGDTIVHGQGPRALFLAKYNNQGIVQWVKTISNTNDPPLPIPTDFLSGIAFDVDGNIILGGSFSNTEDFGGKVLTFGDNGAPFIAKYTSGGSLVWVKPLNTLRGTITDVATDQSGKIFAVGGFTGDCDFDGVVLTANGALDGFVLNCDSTGSIKWVRQIVAAGQARQFSAVPMTIAMDRVSGELYCTGIYSGEADFGGGVILSANGSGGNTFAAKYSTNGSFRWAKGFAAYSQGAGGVSIDRFGQAYFSGCFLGAANFGDTTLVSKPGNTDIFVVKMDEEGKTLWAKQAGAAGGDDAPSIVAANDGHVTVTGVSWGGAEFGSLTLDGEDSLDCFVWKFNSTVAVPGESDSSDNFFSIDRALPLSTDLDMGQVLVSTIRDSIVTAYLQNQLNTNYRIDSVTISGADANEFALKTPIAGVLIRQHDSLSVEFRFRPFSRGSKSATVSIFTKTDTVRRLILGEGIDAPPEEGTLGSVSIDNDSAYAGDHSAFVARFQTASGEVLKPGQRFMLRFAYDHTLISPSAAVRSAGTRFDTVTIAGQAVNGQIARVPFIAMLGSSEYSQLKIVDFSWIDVADKPTATTVQKQDGTFHLLGVCPAVGPRLFDPSGSVKLTHVSPNPSAGSLHIQFQTIEKGRTRLSILNMVGQETTTIQDGEIEEGLHDIDFNTRAIPAGSYFLSLTTPTVRRIERFDVSR